MSMMDLYAMSEMQKSKEGRFFMQLFGAALIVWTIFVLVVYEETTLLVWLIGGAIYLVIYYSDKSKQNAISSASYKPTARRRIHCKRRNTNYINYISTPISEEQLLALNEEQLLDIQEPPIFNNPYRLTPHQLKLRN